MNRFKILRTHKLDLKINKNAFGDENFCRFFGSYIYIYKKAIWRHKFSSPKTQ